MNDVSTAVAERSEVKLTQAHSAERDAFELALRKAKVLAASTLVPPQYQDNIPNCLIGINMARRIGADELMVLQNLYIVQGKPGWSAQFLIATFNQCGRFTALRYEWQAEPGSKDRGCRAYATERETGERIVGSWVTWKMAEAEGWTKKTGSKWLTIPDQMFQYRAAAFLIRTHAPEIAMGLQTIEEIRDVVDIDITPDASTKTDAVTAALKAKLAPAIDAPHEPEPATAAPKPKQPAPAQEEPAPVSFAAIAQLISAATTTDALDEIADLARSLPEAQRAEIDVEIRARRKALA